ncbi:MAG: IPT/TIG domain-containing protein [Candidatus Sericytochromatia bacterium]
MKYSKVALAVLMVSCTSLPSGTHSKAPVLPASHPAQTARVPLASQQTLPLEPLIDSAQAQIKNTGQGDELSLKVIIQKPGLRTQQLELDKISHLRAWVAGSDIATPIYNLNQYVAVSSNGENTSLRIQTVPRGKNRIVSVQGYDNSTNHVEIPGALLKAVYSSPENSTEVVLTFTWRSTATAAILEALINRVPAVTGNLTAQQVNALVEGLNLTQLNALLDQVIYGNNPVGGNTFALHPSRVNAEVLAKALVDANGQVPTLNPGDPTPANWIKQMANLNVVVRTPNNVAFQSAVQLQITDPASAPIAIPAGQDTGNLPQIIPGTWQAIAKIDGLNGGVSSRTNLTVDANGNVTLTEGTTNNPLILPPVMKALSSTQGASGAQLTITGDGFNPAGGNTVKFGTVTATVELATATSLVVKVPPGISGTVPIQVTNNGKLSNTANYTVDTRIVSLSSPGGKVGDTLSIQVSGFDATQTPTVVFSNGVQATVNTQLTTAGTLVVTVPAGAATGPISVTPQGGTVLQSSAYAINTPVISTITPDSASVGATVTLTGANFTGATGATVNGLAVTNLTVVNDNSITFTIPPGASTGTVQVTTPLGTGTSTSNLTIPQQIVALSSPGGKPNDSVTITVSGFNPSTSNPTVIFQGGAAGTITGTTANTVTVTVPAGATTGPITVTPDGGNALQSPTYTVGTPVISSFTSTAPIGNQVTLTGANFTGATQVQFNGVTATTFTVNNDGTITVTVPAGATDGAITVTTPAGTGTTATNFQVLKPPTITNVGNDPLQPTGPIVLTGTGYVAGSVVMIGSTVLNPNAYTIDSPTQITVNTPPVGNTLDSVTIFNAAGSAVSSLLYKDVINFIGNGALVTRTDVNFAIENAHGINVDHNSNIYIASLSHKIYKFNQAGQNQWVSGDNTAGFRKDELTVPADRLKETTLANARFSGPEDLANDSFGNIYVADTSNHAIRKITTDGKVQVIARLPGPEGIEISKNNELFVTCTDPPNATSNITSVFVAKIADLTTLPSLAETQLYDVNKTLTPNVQIIAGGAPAGAATATPVSPIADARFLHLEGLGIDGDGNVYVADVNNYQIRKINFQTNQVSVFATLSYSFSPPNSDTRPWVEMHEIRVDPYGNVFVPAPCCNFGFNSAAKIYRITPTGAISKIAGTGSVGLAEGKPLTVATFSSPRGIDFAPDGTLYIADTSWGIRRIDRYQPLPVNN